MKRRATSKTSKFSTTTRVTDFSRAPAGRYRTDGGASGQRFREEVLVPILEKEASRVTILLDGTMGYGSSFLEEAFGGLTREHGFDPLDLQKRLRFVSLDKSLIVEIEGYLKAPVGPPVPHPMQPVIRAVDGRIRFQGNPVIQWMFQRGESGERFTLNHILEANFHPTHLAQLMQLVGYSVDGWTGLSYVTKQQSFEADFKAEHGCLCPQERDANDKRLRAKHCPLHGGE